MKINQIKTKKRVVVNGANGYVASHFINELIKNDYEVIALARGSKKGSAEDRVMSALSEINGQDIVKISGLKIYDYSLLDADFGMTNEMLNEVFEMPVDYYHFAASLKFDFKSREEIFNTNIHGLENSINVFLDNSNQDSRFFFISTAYSCGKHSGVFEERFYDNAGIEEFRNYYEQSKRYAENVIKKYIETRNLDAHIIRLSQVIGDSQKGITLTDYGIFDFTKRVHSLAGRYPNSTVRVKVDEESSQNLIPINTIVYYLMQTPGKAELPVIMNFVAKQSTKNKCILEALNEMLEMEVVPQQELAQKEMTSLERIVSIGMSFTNSYTDTNLVFSTAALDSIIEEEGQEVDKDSLFKMMDYFISVSEQRKRTVQSKAS